MVKKWKIEAIVTKYQRAKREIDLFNRKKKSYKSYTRDKIDSN